MDANVTTLDKNISTRAKISVALFFTGLGVSTVVAYTISMVLL